MVKNLGKKILLGSLAIGALAFTGCGGSKKEETAGNNANGRKVMDIIVANDTLEGGAIKTVSELFKQENPNIDINLIELPYGDIQTKVKMMIAGGKAPAVLRVTDAITFGRALLELPTDLTADVVPPLRGYMKNSSGDTIALPINATANGLIVNKTLFDKAGVALPEESLSWEEFQTTINEVKDKTGTRYGLVWDGSPHRFSTILYQYGGSFFTPDMTASNFDKPEALNALKKFRELHEDGTMPKSVWVGGEDPSSMFKGGVAVAQLSGSWKIGEYTRDIKDFEWETIKMPTGTIRSTVPGGNLMIALKGSGVEKESVDFLRFMKREDIYVQYLKAGGYLSSFTNVDLDKVGYNFDVDNFKVFVNELSVSPEVAGNEWGGNTHIMSKIHPDIKLEVINMLKGDITPEQAQKEIHKMINETISNNK